MIDEHEPSVPPSPPPPPPEPERQHTGQHRAVTASQADRIAVLPAVELTRRTLRAERIAEEVRANLGRPASTAADGSETSASGLWKRLEPVVTMAESWTAERAAATKGRGWLAERSTKLLDAILPGIVIAVAVAVAAYLTGHWK